jgi:hypothetical protein
MIYIYILMVYGGILMMNVYIDDKTIYIYISYHNQYWLYGLWFIIFYHDYISYIDDHITSGGFFNVETSPIFAGARSDLVSAGFIFPALWTEDFFVECPGCPEVSLAFKGKHHDWLVLWNIVFYHRKTIGNGSWLLLMMVINDGYWLVLWNMTFVSFPNSWDDDPIWLKYFSEGYTTNQPW